MAVAAYVILAWLGLALGSFVNALVWRLHLKETTKGIGNRGSRIENKKNKFSIPNSQYSILSGRSVCPHCRHQLAWYDLLPVVSWLWLRGRCRYCKKPISAQYPAVELALALVFTLSYAFWPVSLAGWQWVPFITWLISSIGLMALLVYDARWQRLPSKIIYSTLAVAVTGRLVYLLGYEPHKLRGLVSWVLSVAVASGIFWALYALSRGAWIGFGDVRLGLLTGTLLAAPAKSFLMIFLASLLGVAFVIPAMTTGRKTLASRLAYGPFLITATAVCVLFGQSIVDWYQRVFLP